MRFKFTRWDDGKYSVSRILYEMDDDNRCYYLEKKQQAAEAAEARMRYLSIAG